jgi:hypothetical protein
MMVISYNKRKQGKNYIRTCFKDPIKELEKEDMFGATPTVRTLLYHNFVSQLYFL